jgi:carboxypeptidase Taq
MTISGSHTNSVSVLIDKVTAYVRETALLGSIQALLEWDELTMLPESASDYRADQVTYLAGEIHKRSTDRQLGQWLNELMDATVDEDPHSPIRATVTDLHREFEKQSKLPKELVQKLAHLTVVGQHIWAKARQQKDYSQFAPTLQEMIKLKKEQAAALEFSDNPYDCWLDDYETHARTDEIRHTLESLKNELVPLIDKIKGSKYAPDVSVLTRFYPKEVQAQFSKLAATKIGFDFQRGRIDETTHPFCTGIAPNDCRITTRYDERFFNSAFFGTLHEAGHGIYDQGLPVEQFGLPPGSFCSLGIHESQSRLWENLVARSQAFWQYFFPICKTSFAETLSDVDEKTFYHAVNCVEPSFIRVEADEATYDLHIVIRFEIEQLIANDELTVNDIPDAWNEKYQKYLGIEPPDAAEGVLQDVHWSAGLLGYFPTYSLGNLYASQFYEQAESELGNLSEQFSAGQFEPLKRWLNENIHQRGRCYSAKDLVEAVTGNPLSHEARIRHLRNKYSAIYQL